MKKKLLSGLFIFVIIGVSAFTAYENPKVVEIPKKNIKYFLKKIGIIDSFLIVEPKKKVTTKKIKTKDEFFANSFTLEIEKIKPLNRKTSGLYFDNNKNLIIFTQDGEKIEKNRIEEINLPLNFTTENEGGVRSVIYFNQKYYGLLSRKTKDCYYSSLINIKTQATIFDTKCIPDKKGVNFAGLGGAFEYLNNNLLISVGTPTHDSDVIDNLSQNVEYLYGKMLLLENLENLNEKLSIKIFSLGHRNPQGLTKINKVLFSTEHGPQGGDELNKIEQGKNYGWPNISLGTRYGGKSYDNKYGKKYKNPIFSFSPSIAPSMLSNCPENLKNYYNDFICLVGLTLKEMSLIVYLIDEESEKLFAYEKIPLDKRLRHFALNQEADLYNDEDSSFYFSADKDGIYKAKFKNFR